MHACMLSWVQLCNPMDCSQPGSSVHGILQARILEGVALPSSGGSSDPGIEPASSCISCTADGFFTTEPSGKPLGWALLPSFDRGGGCDPERGSL